MPKLKRKMAIAHTRAQIVAREQAPADDSQPVEPAAISARKPKPKKGKRRA